MAEKKSSMLRRQQQLIKQQKQVKAAASKKLPAKGGTSAGKPKAVAQRTATAVKQKVTQDVAMTRALADNMKRNQARDARQIPADKSPKVRRVGPGGANPKPQGSLPPGKRGGDIKPKGGSLTTTEKGGSIRQRGGPLAKTSPVEQVKVKDLGKGSKQLPPGQSGGSLAANASNARRSTAALPAASSASRRQAASAKAQAAAQGSTGPNRVGQPAGAANRMYGANRVNAAVSRANQQAASSRLMRGGTATAVVGALLNAPEEIRKGIRLAKDPKGTIQRASEEYLRGDRPVSKAEARRSNKPQRQGPPVPARLKNAPPAPNLLSPTSTARSANDAQASRSSAQREAVGGRTAAPATRQSVTRPSQAQPRTSSGTAGTGRKWEDFNPGRGTSETNNPLIAKDSWLMGKIKQREEGQAKNVGPSKDGKEYSSAKQAADIVARRKKKEEEDKKKSAS
jgi:hypothetical protein